VKPADYVLRALEEMADEKRQVVTAPAALRRRARRLSASQLGRALGDLIREQRIRVNPLERGRVLYRLQEAPQTNSDQPTTPHTKELVKHGR
jgi:hypothetical protein